ncbi:MAG: glycosyltransferase family 39 protein [Planctomycetes bacterium]|nr:glycosyltransferase family 39 protein [Planctomycetota bacterium]
MHPLPMETAPTASVRDRKYLFEILVLFAGAAALLLRLGFLPAHGAESRWLFISKHMLASGDWLTMEMDGAPYNDKPFLSYWIIVISAKIFGELNEWTARLPGVLASLGAIYITFRLGARNFGTRAGLLAAIVLATSQSFIEWSRAATADALNLFFVIAAVAAYRSYRAAPALWKCLLFFGMLGIGGQAKGLPAVVLPLAIGFFDISSEILFDRNRLRADSKTILSIAAGLAFAAAIYFFPFLVVYYKTGNWDLLERVWYENFVRAADPFDHSKDGIFFYVYMLPAMLAPWTLLVPFALARGFARFREDRELRFITICFITIFAIMTASLSRRNYYILPALPFGALLIGDALSRGFDELKNNAIATIAKITRFAHVWILGGLCTIVGTALVVSRFLPFATIRSAAELPFGLALGLALLASGYLLILNGRTGAPALERALALFAIAISIYISTGAETLRRNSLVERDLAEYIRTQHAGLEIAWFKIGRGGLDRYYIGGGPIANNMNELLDILMESPSESRLVVAPADAFPILQNAEDVRAELLYTQSTRGFDSIQSAKAKYVLARCRAVKK